MALGLFYLIAAGAPVGHIAINASAFAVGLAAYASVTVPEWRSGRAQSLVVVALGLVILATALLARPVEGAARWVALGPLSLQVSLILVPPMVMMFARRPDPIGAAGLGVAALSLALQPDRAMAGALAAGIAALVVVRRDPWVLIALALALAGFAAASIRPDNLPAVPYVDQILYTSFKVHPAAGIAVLAGSILLLLPALAGGRQSRRLAFGGVWLAVVAAAALGNYPTPLVGYGGSAIVGYLLSLALIPGAIGAEQGGAGGDSEAQARAG